MTRPQAGTAGLAAASLLGTVALGAWMRWQLAGVDPSGLAHLHALRHAHMHLGYYGILFPVLWLVLGRAGVDVPGPRTSRLYGLFVAVSTVGFLAGGYTPTAIVGSTGVLAIWLLSAWQLREQAQRLLKRDWLAPIPVAILLAALAVPAIAIASARDSTWTLPIVRSFLILLLTGAFAPALLASLGLRAPLAIGWLLAATAGSVAAGFGELVSPLLGGGTVWLALVVAWSAWRRGSRTSPVLLTHWIAGLTGLAVHGLGWIPHEGSVALAGLHYLLLGPVLLTAARLLPVRFTVTEMVHQAALLAMVAAISLSGWMLPPAPAAQLAALAGTVIVACIGYAILGTTVGRDRARGTRTSAMALGTGRIGH